MRDRDARKFVVALNAWNAGKQSLRRDENLSCESTIPFLCSNEFTRNVDFYLFSFFSCDILEKSICIQTIGDSININTIFENHLLYVFTILLFLYSNFRDIRIKYSYSHVERRWIFIQYIVFRKHSLLHCCQNIFLSQIFKNLINIYTILSLLFFEYKFFFNKSCITGYRMSHVQRRASTRKHRILENIS